MSLDLYLDEEKCPTCGHEKERMNFNYTYNVARMWYNIYPDDKGMVFIDGLTGLEAKPKLEFALKELLGNKLYYEQMNPPNGWGNYETFVEFIKNLISACEEYPNLTWSSWR